MDTGQSESIATPRLPGAAERLRAAIAPWLVRHRSVLTVVAGTFLVFAGELAQDLADSPPLQMFPPAAPPRHWILIAAVLLMLASVEVIGRVVDRSMASLQRVVKVDAATFGAYARRMGQPTTAVDLLLLGVSAAIVVLLFVVVGIELTADDPATGQPRYLPSDGVGALLVLSGYTVVGWAGLRLVLVAVLLARALRELSRESLDINVFDTSNVLPFGNVALAIAMAPAAVIVILLVGFGQPTTPLGYAVLSLAMFATILALLLPLRGIHHRMSRAKITELQRLGERVREAHETVLDRSDLDATEIGALADRTSTLIDLRKTVQEMPTWPFRDTLTFGRAVLIASAPLVYTVLSELIRVLWIAPLSP